MIAQLMALIAQASPTSAAEPAPLETPTLVFHPVSPELILCAGAIVAMLYEAFATRSKPIIHLAIAITTILGSGVAAVSLWNWTGERAVLGNTVAVDKFAVLAAVILLVAALVGCLFYTGFVSRDPEAYRGEFFPLVLFATAGMTMIAAANDLILVFLALELLSLSLYVLTGITGRPRANEAAMKYFLLGAFSSAFFLYGVAMAYGASTTTKIAGAAGVPSLSSALAGTTGSQALALLGLALLVIGFGFKISAAPFHMWTPDVYQGAPVPVTAYMSAATKVAAFFAFIRVLDVAFQPLTWSWTPVIYALSVVSMVVGSVLAVAQTDVKRMLAYSSVAHAGFLLTGLTLASATGIRATIFYLIVYAAMTLGSFGVVMLVAERDERRTSLRDVAGLGRRRPLLAALMAVFLLSLAGIPPTAGFVAKVSVFSAAIDAGNWPLVVVAVVASVAAAFFYLRVIVYMYMRDPEEEPADVIVLANGQTVARPSARVSVVAAGLLAAFVLVLGVFPGLLSNVLEEASVLRW
jgi:NADH-quinone oxidoreductase subunit N